MSWIITKYALTAAMVVLVSEVAKRSDKLGGFIAALPLITLLTLIWLYLEKQSPEKIANHAWHTFWYVRRGWRSSPAIASPGTARSA